MRDTINTTINLGAYVFHIVTIDIKTILIKANYWRYKV